MKQKKSFWLTILMCVAIYSAILLLLAYLEARNPNGNIKSFSDATCGGHENSVGAKINTVDFEDFEKKVRESFG